MSTQSFRRRAERAPGGSALANRSPVELDRSQAAVLALPHDASATVLGAPGTGKTTTLIELVASRVRAGLSPDDIVVLAPSRASATRLRDAIAVRLEVATNGPVARTVSSLAFEIVGHAARVAGAEPPKLVTGGDQDSDIAQLLDGQLAEGRGPAWPDHLGPEVRRLRGFRTELRELMMRATEYGVSAARLRELGATADRQEWIAAADFIDDYLAVISTSRPSQLDAAELAQFAVAAIRSDDPGDRVERLRLVIVDDVQEATEATLSILRALAERGIPIIAFGDPDVAANAFRGGEADALGRLSRSLGVQPLVLETVHRQASLVRALTLAVTERIGTAGAGQQRRAATARPDAPVGEVATIVAPTPGRHLAAIAHELREAHLIHGIAWDRMAVVVRSGSATSPVRRGLALAEVPARTAVGGTALRDDRAARALLSVVDVGMGRSPLTPAVASALLTGPFGALDPLALRRLRLALRTQELAAGGTRSSDDLLVEGLSTPGRFATIDARVARNADRLAKTFAALREATRDGATVEELLWLAWDRSGLAPEWSRHALSAGITAAEANENLDGILALFTAAKRFVERQPGTAATVFLDAVLDAEVPEDTLSPQPAADTVLVTTPSGMVGLEFDLVVVASVQEGVWPNQRLRGSLFAPQELVERVYGLDPATLDARKAVIDDELRMLALAVSRATTRVVLSAVQNDDEAPSVFFSLVPDGTTVRELARRYPLSLRGFTGRLRRDLVASIDEGRPSVEAARALARLSAERVPGADPAEWHGLLAPSTDAPLFGDDEQIPVSPSQLEKFEESPLDWFVDWVAGSQSSTAMGLGTIIHWAMEHAESPSADALWTAIESRWGELEFESPWLAESNRSAARALAAALAEYLLDFERDGKSLVQAEAGFSLEIDRARVNGTIDRVERSADGAIVIVDLKTGRPITAQATIDQHAQLAAYQLAYAEGKLDELLEPFGGDHHSGGAKLLYVKEGIRKKLYREGVQQALDDEGLEAFRERVRVAAAAMALATFAGPLEPGGFQGGGANALSLHRVRAVSSD